MAIGLIGRKCGMTRIFEEQGDAVPVTAIQVEPNYITQLKSIESDGYAAVQLATVAKKISRTNKALVGHFSKSSVEPQRFVREFRVEEDFVKSCSMGQALSVDVFNQDQIVDVEGISKGKGFAGAVKRHNFRTQDATHGNSRSHRAPGSIGQNQSPGRVFKGKKMAGHMGDERCTVQSLRVVRVDKEAGVILIRGSVPGATGSMVVIKPAAKIKNKKAEG